jgi:nitrite reductase (NADH) large subunit
LDYRTAKRDIHAIFPNAVAQGRIVAYNLLDWNVTYEGADTMNSLKHLGLPLISMGKMEGEELKARCDNVLRKIYVLDDRITGFRLAGDISSAGIFRGLMNKRVDVAGFKHCLLELGFGMGYIEGLALSPIWIV